MTRAKCLQLLDGIQRTIKNHQREFAELMGMHTRGMERSEVAVLRDVDAALADCWRATERAKETLRPYEPQRNAELATANREAAAVALQTERERLRGIAGIALRVRADERITNRAIENGWTLEQFSAEVTR